MIKQLTPLQSIHCCSIHRRHMFLDGPLDVIVCIGGLCTIIAIANYTLDSTPPSQTIISTPKPPSSDEGHDGDGDRNQGGRGDEHDRLKSNGST